MLNTLIKPLLVGNTSFPNNIIQGPLAGVSSAPFRRLTWRYSQPAFSCTEMISCKTILHQTPASLERFIKKDPNEGPVCFQLSSSNPQELAEATKHVTGFGADLIDLNCGCPVKKIRGKGAGSKLLSDASKLYQLICAMKQNTHVPVSIKIRVDGGSNEKMNADIVNMVNDSDVDFITVHGRHWTEHYETPCRYDEIQYFVEAVKKPVIGNGDIACATSLRNMFATGCAGVMIGRAGVGQPWLIRKLIAEMNGIAFDLPSPQEIAAAFIEHVEELIRLLGSEKFAIIQARKFAKYYVRGMESRAAFCNEVNACEDMDTLRKICLMYF